MLIEILVIIAIIGVVAAILLVGALHNREENREKVVAVVATESQKPEFTTDQLRPWDGWFITECHDKYRVVRLQNAGSEAMLVHLSERHYLIVKNMRNLDVHLLERLDKLPPEAETK